MTCLSHPTDKHLFKVKSRKRRVFVFPAPDPGPGSGPRPKFVFDDPGPNLHLATPVLKLYLPALAN